MPLIDRIAERIGLDEGFAGLPIVVERTAQQDAHAEIDVDQIGRDELAVDDHAGRDEHRPAPIRHVSGRCNRRRGIVEGAPAAEQDAPLADLFVAGQGFVEEVEQVVVQRHDLFHELDVLQQAHQIIVEELHRWERCRRRRGRASKDGRAVLPSGRTFPASAGSSAAIRDRKLP